MTRLLIAIILACTLTIAPRAGGDPSRPSQDVTFGYVDVFVNTDKPLAAYQVDIRATRGDVTIVGIEGGDGVFADPPYYDPRAMQRNHVIIGAFDTGTDHDTGAVRVARIHMRFTGIEVAAYDVKLTTAATTDGSRIDATATLQDGDR